VAGGVISKSMFSLQKDDSKSNEQWRWRGEHRLEAGVKGSLLDEPEHDEKLPALEGQLRDCPSRTKLLPISSFNSIVCWACWFARASKGVVAVVRDVAKSKGETNKSLCVCKRESV